MNSVDASGFCAGSPLTVSSGEVKCSTGKGQKTKAYGDGRYCLVAIY